MIAIYNSRMHALQFKMAIVDRDIFLDDCFQQKKSSGNIRTMIAICNWRMHGLQFNMATMQQMKMTK